MKNKTNTVVTYVSATMLVSSLFGIVLAVLGDISAGVLHGEPETGWGILLAVFTAPVAIISLIVFLKSTKTLAASNIIGKNPSSRWRALFIGLLISILIAVVSSIHTYFHDKNEQPPDNAHDTSVIHDLDTSIESVNDSWRNSGSLPAPTGIQLPTDIRYTIINTDTAKLCGDFQDSTLKYYYDAKHPAQNGGVAAKVVNGSPLGITDSDIAFHDHKSGEQCFLIMMHN